MQTHNIYSKNYILSLKLTIFYVQHISNIHIHAQLLCLNLHCEKIKTWNWIESHWILVTIIFIITGLGTFFSMKKLNFCHLPVFVDQKWMISSPDRVTVDPGQHCCSAKLEILSVSQNRQNILCNLNICLFWQFLYLICLWFDCLLLIFVVVIICCTHFVEAV